MPSTLQATRQQQADPQSLSWSDGWLPWLFFGVALAVLLFNLGGAALFEPDEGRNAEKAREILVLDNWITPHENFNPVLDKPIFFYWLIALAYQLFGVSEWTARLPSALAAFGCVALIFDFARRRWGPWEALWGGWILLSSAGFFVLARIVIFDMTLTLFLTLALCAFYEAAHAEELKRRRIFCFLLYGSLAVATLIKGLIGVVLPGMIFFFYLLITHQWSLLRKIYLIPGAILFFTIVMPWYLQVDASNPGYLRYYFWDEHFGRYTGADFDRDQPWHYFIWMLMAGLFPWTLVVPFVAKRYAKLTLDDKTIYLLLWFALPFLFFSASTSKMPHYVLPILPAASILIAVPLVNLYHVSPSRAKFALSVTALAQAVMVLYLVFGSLWPAVLPRPIRAAITANYEFLWAYGATITIFFLFIVSWARRRPTSLRRVYLTHVTSVALFLIFITHVMVLAAPDRSAKDLAAMAAPQISASTQVVFYDTYLSGMAFYLRAERPIWMVTRSNRK
ncbi:MAG TPA: glycosyltransferase family 39 protein, partial [Candidatus Limnocylindria bacterium]|nr:glycosyltransferase family 39 protein [Candidatus Limnocylindria bacterium]